LGCGLTLGQQTRIDSRAQALAALRQAARIRLPVAQQGQACHLLERAVHGGFVRKAQLLRYRLGRQPTAGDVMQVAAWGVSTVIANHLEALDHCPISRHEMRSLAVQHGVENRLLVPDDGQSYEFTAASASSRQ
jgi:hypothetical protein